MSAEITISIGDAAQGSRKLKGFSRALPGQLQSGFKRAGSIFERDMKKKLSGPGRVKGSTHGPISRLGDYPGKRTGRLQNSVNFQVSNTAGGLQLRVGPNVSYAPFLELGTSKMQPYPFVGPTLEHKADEAVDAIQREIAKPLDRF